MATGAPDNINDYSWLRVTTLTTNQVIGSSNLSGRANQNKGLGQNRKGLKSPFLFWPSFLSLHRRPNFPGMKKPAVARVAPVSTMVLTGAVLSVGQGPRESRADRGHVKGLHLNAPARADAPRGRLPGRRQGLERVDGDLPLVLQ